MATDSKPSITCYSAEEGGFMRRSQKIRGQLFRPLLVLLAKAVGPVPESAPFEGASAL